MLHRQSYTLVLSGLQFQVCFQVEPAVLGIRDDYNGKPVSVGAQMTPPCPDMQAALDQARSKDNRDLPPPFCALESWGAVFFFHSALACWIRRSWRAYSRSASARLAVEVIEDWW